MRKISRKKCGALLCGGVVLLLAVGVGAAKGLLDPRVGARETVNVSQSSISNASNIRYVAHRGFSAVAPENTLPALQKAAESRFWGAEFDIQITKDRVWVLMHDDNILRMTRGFQKIRSLTAAQLTQYPINNGANWKKYPELRIPTLAEALDVCKALEIRPVIEIKGKDTSGVPGLISMIREKGLEKQCIVISFDYPQLQAVREKSSKIPVWLLVKEITGEAVAQAKELENAGVDFDGNNQKNDAAAIRRIVDAGLTCAAWTIDSIEDHDRLVQAGVTVFTTNAIVPG